MLLLKLPNKNNCQEAFCPLRNEHWCVTIECEFIFGSLFDTSSNGILTVQDYISSSNVGPSGHQWRLLIGRELLASDWSRGCHRNGKPQASRIVGSRGSHMTGTGSDVTGTGLNRKSRVLGWETAEQVEKRIVGSG